MRHPWEQLLKDRGYHLRRTIGEGSHSKVKLAYCTKLQREVAIKCISFEKAPADFVANFLPRELKILPHLQHDNIVQVFQIYQHCNETVPKQSYVCIVMEYAKYGDMLKYIQRRGPLSETEIKRYFWQVCQAVKYCHARRLCHRDLKCENLLLGKNMQILLTDFGFCKPVNVDYKGKVTLSKTFCGSAAYAAPETLLGQPYNPFMHDMWSLGVILYIMTCGEMPFDDSNVGNMLREQLLNHIQFPAKIRKHMSRNLKNLIRLLLEIDVSRRGTIKAVVSHPFFTQTEEPKIPRQSILRKERPIVKQEQALHKMSSNPTIASVSLATKEKILHLPNTSAMKTSSQLHSRSFHGTTMEKRNMALQNLRSIYSKQNAKRSPSHKSQASAMPIKKAW